MWNIHTKGKLLNRETTIALQKVRLLSVLMYLAHGYVVFDYLFYITH